MKRITLMRQTLIVGLFFGLLAPIMAQNLFLPASTKSKEAKALYAEAMGAFYDVEFAKLNTINAKALKADPNFFMGYFLQTFSADKAKRDAAVTKMMSYDGKLNKGEKVLQKMAVRYKGDPKYKGVDEWKELIKLYPKNIFPKVMLAYQLGGAEETREEALALLNACIQLNANVASIYNSKGYLFLASKDYDKALMAFDKYIEMEPDKANPYDSKGDYFMAVKDYAKAAKHYKKAYEMNNDFAFSKERHKQAKWMAKRVVIADEVNAEMKKLLQVYNAHDMAKYAKFYLNTPEFCFVMNGEAMSSYSDFVKNLHKSKDKYREWNVEILKQTIEIPAENIATITQVFVYTATPLEGDKLNDKGNYTTVWRKEDGRWKVVQAIEVYPMTE